MAGEEEPRVIGRGLAQNFGGHIIPKLLPDLVQLVRGEAVEVQDEAPEGLVAGAQRIQERLGPGRSDAGVPKLQSAQMGIRPEGLSEEPRSRVANLRGGQVELLELQMPGVADGAAQLCQHR